MSGWAGHLVLRASDASQRQGSRSIRPHVEGDVYETDSRLGLSSRNGGPHSRLQRHRGTEFQSDLAVSHFVIDGVVAQGTRRTLTIPAGAIGNERPIESVTERWFSPELQVVVMSRQRDPRFGETTYHLTNIKRTEPAATLFQVAF